jgi:predicted transcriptional regulator
LHVVFAVDSAMSNSVAELNAFHQFAEQRLRTIEGASLEDCWEQWQSDQERREVQAAILEGLADAEAGRLMDLDTFDREFRQRHGIVGKS